MEADRKECVSLIGKIHVVGLLMEQDRSCKVVSEKIFIELFSFKKKTHGVDLILMLKYLNDFTFFFQNIYQKIKIILNYTPVFI